MTVAAWGAGAPMLLMVWRRRGHLSFHFHLMYLFCPTGFPIFLSVWDGLLLFGFFFFWECFYVIHHRIIKFVATWPFCVSRMAKGFFFQQSQFLLPSLPSLLSCPRCEPCRNFGHKVAQVIWCSVLPRIHKVGIFGWGIEPQKHWDNPSL